MSGQRTWGKGVLIAHGVWAAINFSLCLLLVLAGGGHPPPLIFLPLVVAVWAVGHAAIWIAGRIAARGRRSAAEEGGGVIAWPLGLKLALVLTGFASSIGIIQVVVTVLLRELYPFRILELWILALSIWVVHGACFVGLLLRKRWSRWLCAALPLGWAALLAAQIVDHLLRDRPSTRPSSPSPSFSSWRWCCSASTWRAREESRRNLEPEGRMPVTTRHISSGSGGHKRH